MAAVWKTLMRRKIIQQPEDTSLGRVLGTWDLTFLGVGATLGIGLYVLVGKVARENAGPSIVISFLIAAIASAFAALCYAEFGARVPRAGSAYVYSYVCIGEIVAFIIGWNLILEYVIGSASVAHGISLYIDSITNDTLKRHFSIVAPIDVSFLAEYFDFCAFGTSIVLSVGLALGVRESSLLNNVVTVLNLAVVLFVFIAGGMHARIENWRLPAGDAPNIGEGGFFPFGFTGVVKGAAICFYGFVGFDCIATTGEEARNPRTSIPIAILVSLGVSFIAYCGTSAVATLMVPYYEQNINSPLPFAFDYYDMQISKWIVTIGGLLALSASLFGAMFPLPRIIYAMANDGLIFRFLGIVNTRFATPLIGTLFAGLLTGILGGLFEQSYLINMMSIGTLLAYTVVAACVLILRYSVNVGKVNINSNCHDDATGDLRRDDGWFGIMMNSSCAKRPSERSEFVVILQVGLFCVLAIMASFCAKYLPNEIRKGEVYAIVLLSVIAVCLVSVMTSMHLQPQNDANLSFKVPFVPIVPCLSIIINIYLMMALDVATWIRFGIWMLIGLPIYWFSIQYCSNKRNAMAIVCIKNRNFSEGSTYVNFGYIHGDAEEHMKESETVVNASTTLERVKEANQHAEPSCKYGADSDSGAYFEDNEPDTEQDNTQKSVNMLEEPVVIATEGIEDKSVQDALGTLDVMLEKEEEKCGEYVNLGMARFRNRSVSIVSSASNNSNNFPTELSVVAIIHHEDEPEPIIEEVEIETQEELEMEREMVEKINGQVTEAKNGELITDAELLNNELSSTEDIEETIYTEIASSPILPPPLPPPLPPTLLSNPPSPKPPSPPSMSQFELFKLDSTAKLSSIDFSLARSNLDKVPNLITSSSLSSTTSADTSESSKRRPIPSKSETNLSTSPENNINLKSEHVKLFKSKLAAKLGHMPKNLKFNINPAPLFHSLDRKVASKAESGMDELLQGNSSSLKLSTEQRERKNSGVIDDSLKNVDMAAIKERLTNLYSREGGNSLGEPYKNKQKHTDEKDRVEFGESGV